MTVLQKIGEISTVYDIIRQALFYHILIENERDTLKSILIK